MAYTEVFTSVIDSYLPEPHASLLNGIIFGVDLNAGKEFYEKVKIVGLLHIVVLSGINITILASIISSSTSFLQKKYSVLISLFCIILFVFFVGPEPPIVRAAFMGSLGLIAILWSAKATPLYILFLSFVLTAIFKLEWIKTISLQLSYGATLGIILFGQAKNKKRSWLGEFLARELRPSLAAQAFTTPIIFLYFKQISLIAPVSNLLTSFIVPPLMIFGFLTAILGKIHFSLGLLPSFICYVLLSYIIFVIDFLAKLPFVFIQF